jgi:hypothetical protein
MAADAVKAITQNTHLLAINNIATYLDLSPAYCWQTNTPTQEQIYMFALMEGYSIAKGRSTIRGYRSMLFEMARLLLAFKSGIT